MIEEILNIFIASYFAIFFLLILLGAIVERGSIEPFLIKNGYKYKIIASPHKGYRQVLRAIKLSRGASTFKYNIYKLHAKIYKVTIRKLVLIFSIWAAAIFFTLFASTLKI